MSTTGAGNKKLFDTIAALSQKQATGKLLLACGELQWQFYFFNGQLVYGTGGLHRTRRWYRSLQQNCPNFQVSANLTMMDELWEYQLLQAGISQNQLSLTQAKGVIRSTLFEMFFTILSQPKISRQWQPSPNFFVEVTSGLWLSLRETQQILQQAKQVLSDWIEMDLNYISPEQSPLLKQSDEIKERVSHDSLLTLNNHFNGQHTLWDIALQKKQSLPVATRTLHHFFKHGLVELRILPDLPSPLEQLRLVYSAIKRPDPPLVACIDDSLTICEFLEHILIKGGYRALKILDPMSGMATLEKHRPALILLDLIMPKVSGYTVCNFLRKTPMFRDTPIIILTGQDGIVDRTRAKFTGASEFLSKSSPPEKVLQVVDKYLKVSGNFKQETHTSHILENPPDSLAFAP